MIQVISIIGNSIDLLTRKEMGHGLVLSNGTSTVTIPVTEEAAGEVAKLYIEDLRKGSHTPKDDSIGDPGPEYVDHLARRGPGTDNLRSVVTHDQADVPLFEDEIEDEIDVDGAGSEYDDSLTGVASL